MLDLDVGRIGVDKLGSSLWVVALGGEHDLASVGKLHTTLAAIFAQGTAVVIDLSATTFIDSSILGELVAAQRRADANPSEHLAIVAPQGGVAARLIALVGFGHLFKLFETRADALEWTRHPEHEHAGGVI
jgi:anti-sigma B factor antagonist